MHSNTYSSKTRGSNEYCGVGSANDTRVLLALRTCACHSRTIKTSSEAKTKENHRNQHHIRLFRLWQVPDRGSMACSSLGTAMTA